VCIDMKITNGSLLNIVALFFVICIEHSKPLPWDSPQQNDDFLRLLVDNPPVGINIFSHFDAATMKVPDARGWDYDVEVTGTAPEVETGLEDVSTNSANIVSSLYGRTTTELYWPSRLEDTFTVCWATRYHNASSTNQRILECVNQNCIFSHRYGRTGFMYMDRYYSKGGNDPGGVELGDTESSLYWAIACFNGLAGPENYVVDQTNTGISEGNAVSNDDRLGVNNGELSTGRGDFNIHSVYVWNTRLSNTEMKIVTRALRKEIGGIPFAGKTVADHTGNPAVVPISDLRAYNLRWIIALRPPQSINIFADFDFDTDTVPDRIGVLGPVEVTPSYGSRSSTEGSSHGANNDITFLSGGISTKLLWPEQSVPRTMTMCFITRLTGVAGRILNTKNSPPIESEEYNSFYGHHRVGRGVCNMGGWATYMAASFDVELTDWLVMCVNTAKEIPDSIITDQQGIAISHIKPSQIGRLNVNYWTNHASNWEVHSVYIWDVELGNVQMKQVTSALRAQIGGTPDGDNQEAVDPMVPAPTAYEQMCQKRYHHDVTTGDCIPWLPWKSAQQNDDFLEFLLEKPPVGINIFSHYEASTGKVPDARGFDHDVLVTGTIFTETGGDFNAVNEVVSLNAPVGTTWDFPAITDRSATCWLARSDGDWVSMCSTTYEAGPGYIRTFYVRDQISFADAIPIIDTNNANWVHSRYHWNEEFGDIASMMLVTRALRKEIGGTPYDGTEAVVPISDLRAYHLRFLIALRSPQSINIFADLVGSGVGATVRNRVGPGFEVQVTQVGGGFSVVTGTGYGAANEISSLRGTSSTRLLWPINSVPATMTICSVSRYTGGHKGRILGASNSPDQPSAFDHGHNHDGWRGTANYGSWESKFATDNAYAMRAGDKMWEWVIMCGGSTDTAIPGNVVIDNTDIGTANSNIDREPCQLSVNYWSTDDVNANFELHSVYIWDQEINNAQMHQVTAALRAQLGGKPEFESDPVVAMVPAPTAYEQMCPGATSPHATTGDCELCAVDTYKAIIGHTTGCLPCPLNTVSDQGSTQLSQCICLAGFIQNEDGFACVACEPGTFKYTTMSSEECKPCPLNTVSEQASSQLSQCICQVGFTHNEDGVACEACEKGTFKDITGAVQCTPCPLNTVSDQASSQLSQCICPVGFIHNEDGDCAVCPEGTWPLHDQSGCYGLPWNSTQQNDDFLRLLLDKPPVGINIFSHYDATTGKVPDARGWDYNVTTEPKQFPPVDAMLVEFENHDQVSAKMTITGAQQGNGDSYLEWSPSLRSDALWSPSEILNPDPDKSGVGGWWYPSKYEDDEGSSSYGQYQGDDSLDGTYLGDWFTFTCPVCFSMTSSNFVTRANNPGGEPGKYRIYAVNTDGVWTVVHEQTTKEIGTINLKPMPCYRKYGFVANELYGSQGAMNFLTWTIMGVYGGVVTEPGGNFNAGNPVKSLYSAVGTTWDFPSTTSPTFTTCWLARHDEVDNSDWNSVCSTSDGAYVRDQQSVDVVTPMISTSTANWVHSRYHWNEVLSRDDMIIVTRALRKEIGGKPFLEQSAVVPISDLRAYHLRLLIALRPPQSINIFADFEDTTVPDRIGLFPVEVTGDGAAATLVNSTSYSDGASNPITSMAGTYGTGLLWPKNSIPQSNTICSVSRYTSTLRKRILQCSNGPNGEQSPVWLHGHHSEKRGVAYYFDGWKTPENSVGSEITDWLVMCGTSGGEVPGNIIVDQLGIGTAVGGNGHTAQLNVNYHQTEQSDFQLHSLYIWDVVLNPAQMKHVTSALRAQIGGTPDGDNQEAVDAMVHAPTAYEQMCPVFTYTNTNTGDCICKPGYTSWTYYGCTKCAGGTYKTTGGNHPCTECPVNTISVAGSTQLSQCLCNIGYTHIEDGLACAECEEGTFKNITGAVQCTICPYHMKSSVASVSESDCKCIDGYYGESCIPCPRGTTSQIGAETKDDCLCMPGWVLFDGECTPCPSGSYKWEIGDGTCTPCT